MPKPVRMSDIIRDAAAIPGGSRKRKQGVVESRVKSRSALEGAVDDLFGSSMAIESSSVAHHSSSSAVLPGSLDKSELVFDADGNMVLQTVSTPHSNERVSSAEATTTVDSATCGYEHAYRRPKPTKWSKEETCKFYEALELYGSDQMLINTMLPKFSAVQIRQKFKAEQRNSPSMFHKALYSSKKELDMRKFEEQHGVILSLNQIKESTALLDNALDCLL